MDPAQAENSRGGAKGARQAAGISIRRRNDTKKVALCAGEAHWLAESMVQYTPKRWATPAPALQCLLQPLCLIKQIHTTAHEPLLDQRALIA